MRLDINLATQPYQDAKKFWMQWGAGLVGLGLLTLVLLYAVISGWIGARSDRKLIQQRQEQIAARDNDKAQAQALLNLPQNHTTHQRSQYLNDLFQRKAFSWTRVFEDLEQVMPPRLHVVSIRPEMGKDNQLEIKLVVAGESRERAEELVRRMEVSRNFQQTHINFESTQVAQNSGDNVQFDISALYIPVQDAPLKRSAQ